MKSVILINATFAKDIWILNDVISVPLDSLYTVTKTLITNTKKNAFFKMRVLKTAEEHTTMISMYARSVI